MRLRLLISSTLVALALPVAAEGPTQAIRSFELSFWIGPKLRTFSWEDMPKADARIKLVDGHPCGEVVIARVGRIPRQDDGMMQPEQIREIDSAGTTLRTWLVPVDAMPIALDGARLQITVRDHYYWIDLDRRIATGEKPDNDPPPGRDCPTSVDLPTSAYRACADFVDASTGHSHVLAYEMVCT